MILIPLYNCNKQPEIYEIDSMDRTVNKPATGIILNDEYFDSSSFGEDYNEIFFENDGLNAFKNF